MYNKELILISIIINVYITLIPAKRVALIENVF